MQHPNIVQIYEVVQHDTHSFLALEYIEGGSLDRLLRGMPQPAKSSARLVETLARAVHYAHQQGIIHRDLKPANVLIEDVTARGRGVREDKEAVFVSSSESRSSPSDAWLLAGLPKITDFGLAKQLYKETGQTRSGQVLGTPSYMAPEQADAKFGRIGAACDVYALGAILYELLTGRPPFRAETPVETVMQVLYQEVLPPRRFRSKLPHDLETICLKCLQKDPQRRYGSAAELAEDLRRFTVGEPITARPVGMIEKGLKWARRRPAAALLVLTTAVALVSVPGAAVIQSRAARQAAEIERLKEKKRADAQDLLLNAQAAATRKDWTGAR